MSSNDIPPQNRGTIQIGQQTLHYERSDKTGQLYVAPGPDLRDWTKIESGALDYSHIAQQEHQAFQDNPALVLQTGNVFPGHDGAKAAAACATCAAKRGMTADGQYIDPPVMAYAEVAEIPAEVQAANDQHAAQAAAEAAQAAADAQVKATLPPSREVRDDLAKQAKMDAQRAELDAQEARIAGMLAQLQGTGQATAANGNLPAAQMTAHSGVTGAADPKDNAGIPPTDPDVIAGATPDVQAQSALAGFVDAYDDEGQRIDTPPRGATTTNGEATYTPYDDPDTRPTMGTDPWTHTPVKIFWAIEGADPDHPYGKKKDGTPRRPVGRKAGS